MRRTTNWSLALLGVCLAAFFASNTLVQGKGKPPKDDPPPEPPPPTVSYSIEILPTLGGDRSAVYGMNGDGDAVGLSYTEVLGSRSWPHGFLYDYQTQSVIDLHDLFVFEGLLDNLPYGPIEYDTETGWVVTTADDLNDSGQIIGTIRLAENGIGTETIQFRYTPETATTPSFIEEILPLVEGDAVALRAINNAGLVVGYALGEDGLEHPVAWSEPFDETTGSGGTIDLGIYNGQSTFPSDVNDFGELCGSLNTNPRAWRLDAAGYLNLGKFQKGKWGSSAAGGINNLGEVAGSSTLDTVTRRAFIYDDNNGMQDLGTLGGSSSWGGYLNDNGEVVGNSHTAGDEVSHAFLYSGGAMIDIEDSIPGFANSIYYELLEPRGITNSGTIIGITSNGSGLPTQVFVLTPN